MRGFRQALHSGVRFAHNAFAHGRRAAMHIDRTIGSAAKLYSSLAPALAPLAKELFGEGKTSMAHKAISKRDQLVPECARQGPESAQDG